MQTSWENISNSSIPKHTARGATGLFHLANEGHVAYHGFSQGNAVPPRASVAKARRAKDPLIGLTTALDRHPRRPWPDGKPVDPTDPRRSVLEPRAAIGRPGQPAWVGRRPARRPGPSGRPLEATLSKPVDVVIDFSNPLASLAIARNMPDGDAPGRGHDRVRARTEGGTGSIRRSDCASWSRPTPAGRSIC